MIRSTIARLDAHDRWLFLRCSLEESSRMFRILWVAVTHLGGATATIAAAVLPLFAEGTLGATARHALATLVASHIAVQFVKRTVGRPRPRRGDARSALVVEPDRFSFPSGHSAAAMSIALAYAAAYPTLAVPLLAVAGMVGMSRVFLGVHYPGDVLAGQFIAVVTYVVLAR